MGQGSGSDAIDRVSLSDAVYLRLRDEILSGALADGAVLSQVKLAERFEVSRIPVREALRRLQAESLVVVTPYQAYVVRRVTPEQVLELVDVRIALEDLALSRRSPLSKEEVATLRALNEQMAGEHGGARFLALDRELHQRMLDGSPMIRDILGDVRDKVSRYMSSMVAGRPGRDTATGEHSEIIDTLESGDIRAARRLLRRHILQSRSYIAARLEAETKAARESE